MNYKNAQIEILKDYFKNKKGQRFLYGEFEENKIVGDGFHFYIIKNENCLINLPISKISDRVVKMLLTDPNHIINQTNEIKKYGKDSLIKFECEQFTTYINEKLLKHFDVTISTFKADSPTSRVVIYEGDTPVGVVMPTRVTE